MNEKSYKTLGKIIGILSIISGLIIISRSLEKIGDVILIDQLSQFVGLCLISAGMILIILFSRKNYLQKKED